MLDTHQHFWVFDPIRDAWITTDMSILRRDFLPPDIHPAMQANGITGCVAVQADQSAAETRFLLELAEKYPYLQAVVGWADLQSDQLEEQLDQWSAFKKLRGFRHILQAESPEFMLQKNFLRGIATLTQRGYTYDILVFPRHLTALRQFLKQNENQRFIIDHLAKPYIRRGLFRQWAKDIRAIARYENVYCKVSGMVTEAHPRQWHAADFRPYLDVVFEAFGTQRVVYGSDWPVCLLAADYSTQKTILDTYLASFSGSEQSAFWMENGLNFYGIQQ